MKQFSPVQMSSLRAVLSAQEISALIEEKTHAVVHIARFFSESALSLKEIKQKKNNKKHLAKQRANYSLE